MEKRFKNILLMVLLAAMLASVFGLGDDLKVYGQEGSSSINLAAGEFNLDALKKYEGKKITIYQWWDVVEEEQEIEQEFTDKTGVVIENVNIPWDQYLKKVETAVASGKGPDIVWNDRGMPTWVYKKIILPVSDYISVTKEPFKSKIGKTILEFYSLNGKTYAVGIKHMPYKLYYNKEKFRKAKLEDPLEVWKQGKWTWKKFFEMGKALTKDTDGDKKVDQWGYDAWPIEQWVFTNGANFITYSKGKPVFRLDDPKALTALQVSRDIDTKYEMKAPYDPDMDPQSKFEDGITAMCYWGDWDLERMRTTLGDKLGFVSFPIGPDYISTVKSADLVESTAVSIAASCKTPELAAAYLKWYLWPRPDKQDPERERVIEELYENNTDLYNIFDSEANNAKISPQMGFGQEVTDLINTNILLRSDSTPAKLVKQAKAKIQAAIDKAIKVK